MSPHSIRKAAFAGSWYPARASECERQIEAFLAEDTSSKQFHMHAVGGIVPHAGWYFSGSIACRVFHALKQTAAADPDVLLLFGMHLHPQSPRYMMAEGAWETPFGSIEVDRELAAGIMELHEFVVETPTDFTPDNTVELQLPFLKYFFQNAKVVAMGVPPSIASLDVGTSAVDVARKLGRTAMIVGSTDLTHYGANYGFTAKGRGKSAVSWVRERNDPLVIDAMLDLDSERIVKVAQSNQNACCAGAAATAVAGATRLGADMAEHVAYATSYEKSPGDSFVGYVGILMGKKK